MVVSFHYADVSPITLSKKTVVKSFIELLFKGEKVGLEQLSYVFCSDEYLLDINKQFLKHDFYTDIITFGLSAKGEAVTGEIYISIDRVKENAKNHNVNYSEELLRVIFHGALHLCGYKDKTKREITIMREKEEHYLRLFEKA